MDTRASLDLQGVGPKSNVDIGSKFLSYGLHNIKPTNVRRSLKFTKIFKKLESDIKM